MPTPDPPADDGDEEVDDGHDGDEEVDDGDEKVDGGRGGDEDCDDAIDVILAAFELKDERRTGWQLRGVSDPETVADHSWGVAYLLLAIGDRIAEELTDGDAVGGTTDATECLIDRALRLAVVHDVAEAITGDVATRANSSAVADGPTAGGPTAGGPTADDPTGDGKVAAERAAMAYLADPLPDRVREAWEAYEARDSPEAILVKECDLIDVCLQALAYERADRYDPTDGEPGAFQEYDDLDEFFATAEPRLRTDAGRAIVATIRRRYEAARDDE